MRYLCIFSGSCQQFPYPEADLIRQYYQQLLTQMFYVEDVVNKLFQENFLTNSMRKKMELKANQYKNDDLLTEIMFGNKQKFDAFLKALDETGQSDLANLLQSG